MNTFTIGNYKIYKKRIGKGAFSIVYKGFHVETNKMYAIQEINLDSLSKNKIKNLTLNLMDQTINVALEAKVSNILIISSDKTIESKLTKDKVTFVYQENEDLNKAIKNGFEISFSKNQIPIFLPCDLPLINKNNIKNIKNIMNKNFDVCIAPSKSDFGTNSLAWSNEKKDLFYGFFGENSYKKYTEYFSIHLRG